MNKLVITEEGEVVDELYPGDRIVRKSSIDSYKENYDEAIDFKEKDKFIKIFEDALDELVDERLTGGQFKILLTMLKYLRYTSGLVAYKNGGKPLDTEDIMILSKVSKTSFYREIEKLQEKRIIIKAKYKDENNNVKYFMNPFIFCRGTKINLTLLELFKDSKWCTKNKY